MTNHTPILCRCGKPIPPKTGRGPKHKSCFECRAANDAQGQKDRDRANSRVADSLLTHITRVFRTKYQVLGVEECQSFFATLYAEMRRDQIEATGRISVHFRRALTNKTKIEGLTFGRAFAAFCKAHRGLTLMEITLKKPRKGCLKAWDAKMSKFAAIEQAAMGKSFEQIRLRSDSPYSILMRGFKLPAKGKTARQESEVFEPYTPPAYERYSGSDFIIEDDAADDVNIQIETPKPSIRKLVIDDISRNQGGGMTYPLHIYTRLSKDDYEKDQVFAELRELLADGLIVKSEWTPAYELTPQAMDLRIAA